MYKSHLPKIQLFTNNARLHIRAILVKVQYQISCATFQGDLKRFVRLSNFAPREYS